MSHTMTHAHKTCDASEGETLTIHFDDGFAVTGTVQYTRNWLARLDHAIEVEDNGTIHRWATGDDFRATDTHRAEKLTSDGVPDSHSITAETEQGLIISANIEDADKFTDNGNGSFHFALGTLEIGHMDNLTIDGVGIVIEGLLTAPAEKHHIHRHKVLPSQR